MTNENSSAAIELAHRRTKGITGPLLPSQLRPQTFEEAFSLQQAIGQIFAGVSASEVAGWKCGLLNDNIAVIGGLYHSTVQYKTSNKLSFCKLYSDANSHAAVEPELAFELSHDLPPRDEPYSETEIDAAIGVTRLALELIQSRYETPHQATFFDALADGMVNQGVWLGPKLSQSAEHNLMEFILTIQYSDGRLETKVAKHPSGNPRAGIYWLVNFLSTHGIGMCEGQHIITGSYAGVLKLPMHQAITLSYGELGTFLIRFENK
jgi:2-keto-4-pentenoate hydratase